SREELRSRVAVAFEEPTLFSATVGENVLMGGGSGEEDLDRALAVAQADFAHALPQGTATQVGEQGLSLSGGQRQRLALARALLADFPVLVLDEPAEHLDLPTADALTADLLAATEGRTTVLVTHRLAGLEAVDEVIVLDAGRVVQRGRYEELRAVDGPLRDMALREEEAGELVAVS
ncbi:ATP-binding cassette domain-containing protein, partial [Streptomyces sp. NPDC057062]|uniref:ATP-binding cassette domain-containing protein n=1 Tax=Streptomyces sp. NPDC057062 TaxID=3346011 RepID=UPI003644FEA0